MKQPIRTNRAHLIIFITLMTTLLSAGKAWAAIYWDPKNTSGHASDDNNGTAASRPVRTWTKARNLWAAQNPDGGSWVYMMSQREITTGDGVFNGSTNSGNMKIRRHSSFSGSMFLCPKNTHLQFSNMTIDGGTTFNTTYVAHSGVASEGKSGAIIEAQGDVTITNCILQRANGRAIVGNNDGTKKNMTLTDVTIRGCKASAGTAVYFPSPDYHNAVFTRVTISGCYSTEDTFGGTIRENGGTKTNLTLTDCTITNNKSKCGAAVFWNAAGESSAICIINGTTKIHGNIATLNGGGVYAETTVKIQGNVQIYNNKAQYGGGVYLRPYWGGARTFDGEAFDVTIQDNVKIYSNEASKCGGGIFAKISNSPDVGFAAPTGNNTNGTPISPHYKLTVAGNSEIKGNKAPLGAGIGVWDVAPKKNKTTEGTSKEILRTITVSGGSIFDNETTSVANPSKVDPDRSELEFTRAGAGIYIRKYKLANNETSEDPLSNSLPNGYTEGAGTITVNISGGLTYNNKATSGYGGGFYINNEFYGGTGNNSGYCNVNVSGSAQVYGNTCGYDGAGIYLTGGTFTMTGGTIGKSPVASNGNRASRNGGGFFVDKGVCKVQGGTISYNKATGNGGGFYVDPGSGVTTNINSSSATTTVSYNEAVNGAGAYVNSGTLAIATAATEIQNNTASTSGGGVYVNGGTVTANDATIASNTAATDGGGIYSSSGTVTLTSAQVNSNTATGGNGGGVYAGSSVTVTSATLTGNAAIDGTNGKGGGIYATATVNIGGTSSALSSLTSNQARLGGGVYADNTSVTIGYANIGDTGAGNSATDGGGVYAAGTVTLNTGTAVQSNTASNDGGGVYVNNATFTMNAGAIGGSGTAYGNTATGGNGGGVYITGNSAKVQVLGGTIGYNTAPSTTSGKGNGGGIYVASSGTDGTAISGGAKVSYNTAKNNGGGIYVVSGKVSLAGTSSSSLTSVIYNTAQSANGGGVYLGGGEFILGACSTIGSNSADNGNGGGVFVGGTSPIYRQNGDDRSLVEYNTANNGAGLYMGGGTCYLSAGYIHANTADVNGGGIYMGGGTFQHSAGEIGRYYNEPNQAVNGGGLYVNGGDYYSTESTAWINGNKATSNGGGIYMNGGNCYFQGGHLGYNGGSQLNSAVNGAGVYMAGTGHFEMTSSDSDIRGNHATTSGGGIYMEGGTCSITAGTIGSSSYYNQAVNGGGIYAAGGTITVNGGNITYNKATGTSGGYGGGIYSNSGIVTVQSGNITYNTADTDGGGIYAKGTVNFSNGNINNNTATAGDGGGVYIYSTGTLNVSGTATMTSNSATAGLGGGVYQGGIMTADGSQLFVSGNTNGRAKNNVYLPDGQTIKVGSNISTNVNLGIYTERIATVGNNIPVLTCDNGNQTKLNDIYSAMLTGTSNIHDDRGLHQPIYPGADNTRKTLYFGFIEFDYPTFTSDFSNPIDSREKLYQFMCWVNGVNGYSSHPGAEGNVTADIKANYNLWIPIGEANMIGDTDPYTGNFHGNGHVISSLALTDELYSHYGLFGTTQGANIDNLFIEDFDFEKNTPGAMGLVVGDMKGGTLVNTICSGTLTATVSDCIAGGLVGKLEQHNSAAGTIHSCYAGSTIEGYQMGGLVADLAAGNNLYNSFCNTSFVPQSGNTDFMGGLVAVNKGRVENCYPIVRGTAPTGKFGYLAGDNSSTTGMGFYYCYAFNNTYVSSAGTQGNLSGVSTFTATSTPYGYKHHDNQVTAVSGNSFIVNGNLDRNGLKGLLLTLNNWVNQDATHSSTYLPWMRTSASPINGDYPIHNYTNCVCVASKDNIGLEYSADFNTKFDEYITANRGTIYLYQSPSAAVTSTLSNSSGVPALYIHEDVVMMHTSAIKAHVGITLDNSAGVGGATPSFGGTDAIDWHFFSSALADAPIGLTYVDQNQYNLGVYPSWHATFTNANGYFPTNLNDVVDGDDYYEHWDLYGYYEPDYHWVNYKRNSASHWHEDWPDIHIPYTNDTEFVPGKGYLVALKDEGYLQAYGTLNTNTGEGSDSLSVPVTCTSSIGWTTREGHNLLGNPYQSYLDFDAFVRKNESLWKEGRDPFYIIIDEANKGYVLYTVGQSHNAEQASRFLHPHQGFMIDSDVKKGWARFDNGMRTTSTTTTGDSPVTWEGHFRGEETPCYPLVNLMATDANGNRDIVTVELGRPDKGGALKQDAMHSGKGSLWCRYDDEDYALVFTQPGLDAANIRFACDEDAEFTMTWSTHNGEFSYLHLIDNMTGADIDCLSTSEYTFSARESDYNSRFRLVFDYTGIDDHEVPEPVEGPATFAYYANGEIHLTSTPDATAQLQIIDMTGRTIVSRDGVHTVSTTGLAAGVYVLRLTTANGTRTQKIILN